MTADLSRHTVASIDARIDKHEAICEEKDKHMEARYTSIEKEIRNSFKTIIAKVEDNDARQTKAVSSIMNMLRWVGVTVFTAFLGMAGFTAVEWLHSNKADVEAEKVRTEADRVQIQNLNAIVNSLTSSIKPGTVVVNQNPNNQANPPGIPAPPGQVAQ